MFNLQWRAADGNYSLDKLNVELTAWHKYLKASAGTVSQYESTSTSHHLIMLLRNAILAGVVAVDATLAANNTYRWTVNNILAETITSPLADTLTLFATATYLGGVEIGRKSVFLGDVTTRGYLTADQINFSLEFSAPVAENISIIWSLVNTADTNHTFTQDLQNLSNDTKTLAAASGGKLCAPR